MAFFSDHQKNHILLIVLSMYYFVISIDELKISRYKKFLNYSHRFTTTIYCFLHMWPLYLNHQICFKEIIYVQSTTNLKIIISKCLLQICLTHVYYVTMQMFQPFLLAQTYILYFWIYKIEKNLYWSVKLKLHLQSIIYLI